MLAEAIRSAEIEKACAILKARAIFAGQIDGATEIDPARYDEFRKILSEENPDVVLTHWPVDTHRDHRTISLLVYDAWLRSEYAAAADLLVSRGARVTWLTAPVPRDSR